MYQLAWHPKGSFPGEVTAFYIHFGARSLINSFIYALFPPVHLQWLKWKLSLVLLCVTLASRSLLPEFRMSCSLKVWLPWIGDTLLWKSWKENHRELSTEILQVEYGVHSQAVGLLPESGSREAKAELWSCVPYKANQREEKSHLLLEQTLESSSSHSVAWFCVITWISFYVPYQSNLFKFLFNLCLTRLICMHVEKEMRNF